MQVRWEIVPFTRGRGVQVGGANKLFPHFVWVNSAPVEIMGYTVRPDVLAGDLALFASASLDFVTVDGDPSGQMVADYWRTVKVGGYLSIHSRYDAVAEVRPLTGAGGDQMVRIVNGDRLLTVHRKRSDKHHTVVGEPGGKRCGVVRYGAFGDLMQASSVFAGLKAAGYHVTLHAQAPSCDVVSVDPNIDRMFVTDRNQVSPQEVGEYWAYLRTKYDKFVNLSETVEGTLLAMPGRANHEWPHAMRHRMLNQNYLEFQHELAGIAHVPRVRFYATTEEKVWARKQRAKHGSPLVLWSLAGSSVHKTWPYLDTIIARLLTTYPSATVILVGGPECTTLEAGWQNEPRVIKTCGKWSIRQSLSMIDECDLVIGPETGVLNAASCLPVPKVVFLSHSSVTNLTRDWTNTVSLAARNTSCYPCHMLHYNWTHCRQDAETATAACQTDISADEAWAAIKPTTDAAHWKLAV